MSSRCVYTKGVESPKDKIVRMVEELRHECPLLLWKANVVADALSRMTMGSVSHMEKQKKELVNDAHIWDL